MLNSLKSRIINFMRGIDGWVRDRTGPIRVLFVVRNEIGFANQAPMLRELAKFPGFILHTTSDGDEPTFHFSDPELQSLYDRYEIPAERAVFRKWHYLILTDVLNLYFRRNALHVGIGHGCAFGNGYRKTDWVTTEITQPAINLVFGMSQSLRTFVESTHPQAFNPAHRLFFATGFPKLESLANGAYSRAGTLEALGLAAEQKTILISSHWGDYALLRQWGERVLEALLPLQGQCNIIITAHPKLWELPETAEFSPAKLWLKLKAIEALEKNVRIVKSGNSLHLLNAADLLVCCNSSIRVEYALLDRPALFYKVPGQNFFSAHVQGLYEGSSHNFSDLDGLAALALEALQKPEAQMEGRKALKHYFHANPGKSAVEMADIIRKIGRASSPRSQNWKIARELSLNYPCEGAGTTNRTDVREVIKNEHG